MQQFTKQLSSERSRGFTLVELMVTVAVVAILATIAAPSMTSMLRNSRVKSQMEDVTASLQLARSEAMRRNVRVTACPSSDGLTCGASTTRWIAFWTDNTKSPAETVVLVDKTAPSSVKITGSAGEIVFNSSGMLIPRSTVKLCVESTEDASTRKVVDVLVSGLIRTSASGDCS